VAESSKTAKVVAIWLAIFIAKSRNSALVFPEQQQANLLCPGKNEVNYPCMLCRVIMPKDALVEEMKAVRQEIAQLQAAVDDLKATVEENAPRRPGRPDRPAFGRIAAVLETVKKLNAKLPPDKRWAFTQSLLNNSLKVERRATQNFLRDHEAEIAAMHRRYGIDPHDHLQNRGNDLQQLQTALAAYEQLSIKLTIGEAEALLAAADSGVENLKQQKGHDPNIIELAEQACDVLAAAIGYELEE
jgi:hypothetical protein